MDVLQEAPQYFLEVYKRIPVNITHGNGVYLYDDKDEKYLDLLAGIAVNALGYNHPRVKAALLEQAEKNLHLSNFFVQEVQVRLAKKLIELTPFDKVFLTNSGTEAVEGLLKLVKKWGNSRSKHKIISFEGSFHGRTLGAASITGQDKYRKNFQPMLPNIEFVPYNDIEAFNKTVSRDTCAVFFEGISGEGGIKPVSDEMLRAIMDGKKKYDYLVITDEIQTGIGRTGKFYNFQHYDFIPDAIATAKGLGGGLPLGAFLVAEHLNSVFDYGEHGTTYGGNPLACATGLATVEIVSQEDFLNNVIETGDYFRDKLSGLAKLYPGVIKEVRGRGLMLGAEVHHSAELIMKKGIENKLIFNIAGAGTTLRFVPPLILENNHIDQAISTLSSIFSDIKDTNN